MIKYSNAKGAPNTLLERVNINLRDCGYRDWSFRVALDEMVPTPEMLKEMDGLGIYDDYLAGNVHACKVSVWAGHTDFDFELGLAKGPLIYCDGVGVNKSHWEELKPMHADLFRESIRDGWETLSQMLSGLGAEPCATWIEQEVLEKA